VLEAHGEVDVASDGTMVMRGAGCDVTAQQTTASDLRMRSELLDRVESAAVVALDEDGIVTHWNHGAELLYGWGSAEALGRTVDDLGLMGLNARTWRESGAALRRGGSWKGEAEVRRRDGATVPVFLSSSVVTDERGDLMGYVGVSVDLSEAKRAEVELRRSREETIHRLSRAVEMRDMDTGGHIVRIAEYAAEIARRLGLDDDRVELIRVASPMHDVGKLGISDGILRKRGALDPDERREMKRHTTIGYEILSGTGAGVLEMAATIALTHHEWCDGSGYPRELSGEQIPLEGRIVAVADVYDALTSDRVYRKAFSHEEAVEMMRAERGTHFDPKVLDTMLDLLDAR
jgi:putative two-component system response regulator